MKFPLEILLQTEELPEGVDTARKEVRSETPSGWEEGDETPRGGGEGGDLRPLRVEEGDETPRGGGGEMRPLGVGGKEVI